MQRIWRMVAIRLSLTVATALSGAQALPFPAPQSGHHHHNPAGCHEHGPAAPSPPSPAPTSYQCCVNGHHAVIPSAAFSTRPLPAQFARLDGGEDFSLSSTLSAHFSLNVVTSNSPPGIAPLRI